MKKLWIAVSVVSAVILLVGIGLLTWFLLRPSADKRFGDIEQYATFTTIPDVGEMFSWYYPAQAEGTRPVILWLHGFTELPPSLSANIAAFGPYDKDLNRRNDSWVDELNLLFIDAPLGTGFSTIKNGANIPTTLEENAEHLRLTLNSFYNDHPEAADNPLFIFGQGHGAQLALALTMRLQQSDSEKIAQNLKGIALGNPIIDPALVMSKLGFYLEELAYIGDLGRPLLENLATDTQNLVSNGLLSDAFTNFLSLDTYVDNEAGAVAVNMRNIVEKQMQEPTNTKDYFGQLQYLNKILESDIELLEFMNNEVAPALGISGTYDAGRQNAIAAISSTYMLPAVSMVENILENTDLVVTIYNGNLDAISNTPGQLEWVQKLQWNGQEIFLNKSRDRFVVNGLLEGYHRSIDKLRFYWINAAGQSVPLDSPVAMKSLVENISATS